MYNTLIVNSGIVEKIQIKPYDVVTEKKLPEMALDQPPSEGDPLEINGDMYFVCELYPDQGETVRVIPLIVRNPQDVKDIKMYIECLTLAHRKVKFRNKQGYCDLENCEEMIIT